MGKVAAGAMSQQDIKALSDRAIRDTIKRLRNPELGAPWPTSHHHRGPSAA